LSREQKNDILIKVIRSPQFHQSLASLTGALREGGLPTVSEALKVKVANGGHVPGGTMPMGGGDAVEAFLEGVKTTVEEEEKAEEEGGGDGKMDTS
jgi:26S proteasome regulatory subunit N13